MANHHSAHPSAKSLPVVLLAFANNQVDDRRTLRHLPAETRLLREILEPLEHRGLCQLEVRTDVTVDEVVGFFLNEAYHKRVILFHFAGHANSFELLVQQADGKPASLYAEGLANFLGQQEGLQFVFLNGCATEAQVPGLLAAGINSVVATHHAIRDDVATQFATHFYRSLAAGDSLHQAFAQAEAASQAELGQSTQAYREVTIMGERSQADIWPWRLHHQEDKPWLLDWPLVREQPASHTPVTQADPVLSPDLVHVTPPLTQHPAHIFIRYERTTPDEALATQLIGFLRQAGHIVFTNHHSVPIGLDRVKEQKRLMAQSHYLVILLSPFAVHREAFLEELTYALTLQLQILPVYLNLPRGLPSYLAQSIGHIQPAEWRTPADTLPVFYLLYQAIERRTGHLPAVETPPAHSTSEAPLATQPPPPKPYADRRSVELPQPGGALEGDSTFYVVRAADEQLIDGLLHSRETCFSIRAPRQTGKSSILYRTLVQAQEANYPVVSIDLQPVGRHLFQEPRIFLRYFCRELLDQLQLEPSVLDTVWDDEYLPQENVNNLLEKRILPRLQTPIVLAIDEADSLLESSFYSDFFSLIRYWRNRRALKPVWRKLKVILVISTEPYLLIPDPHRSPFNVGQHIQISDFDLAQISNLHDQYDAPFAVTDLPVLLNFTGGHPYLTQLALYTAIQDHLSLDNLLTLSTSDDGPFADHLSYHFWALHDHPALLQSLREVVTSRRCTDADAFHRLKRFGLIKGEPADCQCRCAVYEAYFKRKL
jgi:hypothetical protein